MIHWIIVLSALRFTTKVQLRVNSGGLRVRPEVTSGQTADHLGFDLVMADDLPEPSIVAGRGDDDVRKSHGGAQCGAGDPDAKDPKDAGGPDAQPRPPAQPCRALSQHAEDGPPGFGYRVANKRQASWIFSHLTLTGQI